MVQSLEALFEGQFKIESCNVGIFNTVNELVKLEHKDWFSSLFISVCLIQSHHSLWVIQNISSQSKITSSVNTMSYWFSNLAILLKYKAVQPLKGAFYDIFYLWFHRCWWRLDVFNSMLVIIFGCWWRRRSKLSPTSQSCHQLISSPTSVTNIKHHPCWSIILRTTIDFLPGNAETIIEFECVPTYSQVLVGQILDMNNNVIISHTNFKSGTIVTSYSIDIKLYLHVTRGIIDPIKKGSIH